MRRFPRLYAILDRSSYAALADLIAAADALTGAGVRLLQYRNKSDHAGTILADARELRTRVATSCRLIMNDRADLCLAAEFDGVHVGQDDLSPLSVRAIIGPTHWLGVSTHHPAQVEAADQTPADYIAIGPVFQTSTKANPDPVIGLDGVGQARQRTRKPLVAIGGITRRNCLSAIEAGADSVAVISDLVRDPEKSAEEFLRILG